MHLELKLERLRDKELERENILICAVRDLVRKVVNGDHLILGLGRQEQASQPVRKAECKGTASSQSAEPAIVSAKLGVDRLHAHDILRVVVHAGIPKVEAFQVRHCRALDVRGELEGPAQAGELEEVVRDEGEFVLDREVLHLGRRWIRCGRRERFLRGSQAFVAVCQALLAATRELEKRPTLSSSSMDRTRPTAV